MTNSLTTHSEDTAAALVQTVVDAIVERFDPQRIILFGSRARGAEGPESDLDLFVEMDSSLSPPERAAEIAALFGLRTWSLDLVVYTPREVTRLRDVRGTLLERIEREGRLLYERA